VHMQSCDSVNINTTEGNLNNLLTSAAKFVWNTSANGTQVRSWVVLKQPGISANFQICIECHAGTGSASVFERFIRLYVSPSAGFGSGAAGTLTARPTATDEIAIRDGSTTAPWFGYWMGSTTPFTTTFAPVVHVMQSTDGECTRVVFCCAGKSRSFFIFDKQCNPITGATHTFIVGADAMASDATALTYAEWNDAVHMRGLNSTLVFDCYLTAEGYIAGMLGERLNVVANEISGEWPLSPIGLTSETVGARGRFGTLYDLWWGTSNQADGTTYPAAGSKLLVQFGHLVFPWNGSTPLLT